MLQVQRPPEDDAGLPEYVRKRPEHLQWERPTAWLLGAHVLSSLRQLVLSTVHRSFDLRDWMSAEPRGIALHHEGQPLPGDGTEKGGEYWFDFIADTGDAPALVYCLGRALQRKELVVTSARGKETLPRGRMLIVGGDTAYPVADRAALCERWQAPLVWASRADDAQRLDTGLPIFAIPGNHDYYDDLDGFARQFRQQATRDGVSSVKGKPPPLRLPGYERRQSASYFRLHLPFDWQVWGIDLGISPTDEHPIDTRQLQYFCGGQETPRKLIVVTALPVAVHRAPAKALVQPFKDLRLTPLSAPKGSVRLDLSGDVHLYERYWGSKRPVASGLESDHIDSGPVSGNYAAVVSGLGGAFHHPIQVREGSRKDRIDPQTAWPREAQSRADIADVLTRPRKVFQAGSVGVLGALLAALFFTLAHWWSSPGILALPQLLAGDAHALATADARTTARDFGAVVLFLLGVVLWIGFAVFIRWWTSKIRKRGFDERATWSPIHRALDWVLRRQIFVRSLRWLGANRRVVLSVIRRLIPWALFIASVYGLVLWGTYLLAGRKAVGTNIAAALLLLAMTAFPLVTNDRWRTPWKRAYTALPFLLLGFVHGVAQLMAPYLWAEATCSMLVPFVLILGYWCVRPLATELVRILGKAFVPVWLALLVGSLGTPLVLLVQQKPEGLALWALFAWLAVCVVGVCVGAFRLKRRLLERKHDARTDEERAGFRRVWRWKWAGYATVLWLAFPLQIVAIALLSDGAGGGVADESRRWFGLGAAILGGAMFSCLSLGWYLLVCLQWSWHGNDCGSVARIDDYAEFLRIKVTEDGAEVWAIGVDARETEQGDYPATIRLIDHFTVSTKGT